MTAKKLYLSDTEFDLLSIIKEQVQFTPFSLERIWKHLTNFKNFTFALNVINELISLKMLNKVKTKDHKKFYQLTIEGNAAVELMQVIYNTAMPHVITNDHLFVLNQLKINQCQAKSFTHLYSSYLGFKRGRDGLLLYRNLKIIIEELSGMNLVSISRTDCHQKVRGDSLILTINRKGCTVFDSMDILQKLFFTPTTNTTQEQAVAA